MNKLGAIGSTAAVGAVVATGVNMSAPDENKVLTESLQVANPIVKEIGGVHPDQHAQDRLSELGVVAEKDIESAIDTPEELSIEEEINIVERETVKQLFEILMDAAQNPAQMDTHLDITQRDLNAMVDGTLDPSKFPVENENELIQTLFSMGEGSRLPYIIHLIDDSLHQQVLDRLVADEDLVDTMEYIEAFKNTDISGYISAISEERPDLLIKNLNYLTKSQMHLVDTPSLVYTLFEKGEYDALAEGAQWIHDPELYQSIPTCLVTEGHGEYVLKNLDESFSTINVGKVLKAMDSQGQLDKAVGYMEHIPSKYHQILLDQIVQKYDPEIVVGSIHMFKNIDTTELVESLIQQDKIDMLLGYIGDFNNLTLNQAQTLIASGHKNAVKEHITSFSSPEQVQLML